MMGQGDIPVGRVTQYRVLKKSAFKGARLRIISISLKNQNIYLCHRKPTKNGSFLLTIAMLIH